MQNNDYLNNKNMKIYDILLYLNTSAIMKI